MGTLIKQSLHYCGCCRRELPLEAFYVNKRTHTPDNYCKECRKANSRKHRGTDRCLSSENIPPSYPVITQVSDPSLRNALIRHARQIVAESIERKQAKDKLRALWEE